tara:strand:+ start:9409 stop:11136 length:1728 start_codon:yes stop_codon:yes gene_type:complete
MDYSKANNVLSGWVGSGDRRAKAQAQLGEVMQLHQAQQQLSAEKQQSEDQMEDYLNTIKSRASEIAVRNEDREVIQALYDDQKSIFLSELEKHGNDPSRFMNSGGRRVLKDFASSVLQSDEAARISSNTTAIQEYFDTSEREGGKYSKLIPNSTRREFQNFMDGDSDTFRMKQLIDLDPPAAEEFEFSSNKAEVYFFSGENAIYAEQNYIIEYDLPADAKISQEVLIDYIGQYVGTTNTRSTGVAPDAGTSMVGKQSKSWSARLTGQMRHLNSNGGVSTSVIGSGDESYARSLSDFDSFSVNSDAGSAPANTEVFGHRVDAGNEFMYAKTIFGDSIEEGDNIEGYQWNGSWFNEDGTSFEHGAGDAPDLTIGGVWLGYKVKENGKTRLVKAEDLEGEPKNASAVLMQEYQDEGFWGSDYYYREIPTKGNSAEAQRLGHLKKLDGTLGRHTKETQGGVAAPKASAASNELASFVNISEAPLRQEMLKMEIPEESLKARSILLSLSRIQDAEVGTLSEFINARNTPILQNALMTGDTNMFFDRYTELMMAQGMSEEEARKESTLIFRESENILSTLN